jgi:flavin reductase (DIM6/NTAB) family NADH-FMN oxidoreductase RutF
MGEESIVTPVDLGAYAFTMQGLRPIPAAVTTVADGSANGLISLSAGPAGIVPEAPRAMVSITKYNFTHDLILAGGVFVIHVLSNAPESLDASLEIIKALGGRSGRDGDKLSGLRTNPGTTGAPVLLDSLSYVEVSLTGSLDNQENTIFVGDVVAAGRLQRGGRLTIGEAWSKLGVEWTAAYELGHEAQIAHSRAMRGLPDPGA